MSIAFFQFSEADKGAARWYAKGLGKDCCFFEGLEELYLINPDTVVVKNGCADELALKELLSNRETDGNCEVIVFTDDDIEKLYLDLLKEIDKVMRPVLKKITVDLYMEYYLFDLQMSGYYIISVDESPDRREKYVRAVHSDSRKKLFVAISLDGHRIPEQDIERMKADADVVRCLEYSENARQSVVDDMHVGRFRGKRILPEELMKIKDEANKAWDPFDIFYWGESKKESISVNATEIIELMLAGEFKTHSWFSSNRPVVLEINHTDVIKGMDSLQSILADAIDFNCEKGGEALINEMGQSWEGYSVLRKRIRQYEKRHLVRVNPYGNS